MDSKDELFDDNYQLDGDNQLDSQDDVFTDIVRMYLKDIGRFPLLTTEEEVYYGTMLKHPEDKKLLQLNEVDKYIVSSINKPLLFNSLINNPNYQAIIDDLITFYTKLNSRCDKEVEILERYKSEANKVNRSLNQDELKNIFNISPTNVLNEKELSKELKEYKNYKFAFDKMFVSNLRLVVKMAFRYKNRNIDIIDLINEGNLGLMKAIAKFDISLGNKFSTYATWWIKQSISRFIISNSSDVRLPEHIATTLRKFKNDVTELEKLERRSLSSEEIAEALSLPIELVEEYQRLLYKVVSLDEPVTEEEDSTLGAFVPSKFSVEEKVTLDALKEDITVIFKALTPREILVLKMRFGLCEYDGERHPLEEIAKILHVSTERVRQIVVKALAKVRIYEKRNEKVKALRAYY